MKHPQKIKYTRTAINTELSTKKSESSNTNLTILDESLKEISIDDIPKAALTYKGAFPFLVDAISELCTINPKVVNTDTQTETYVIKNQFDNTTTHFAAALKWSTLVELATRNEPTSKDAFRKEIMKIYEAPPSLYINLGNGHSILTHPFIIRSIVFDDYTTMSKHDAEICARLGIQKKISYVDIEFFKPLFAACFNSERGGFIYTDPAFYAMLLKTISTMRNDSTTLSILNRFYNPRTKQFVSKMATTYHKFILYLLSKIASNEKYTTITFDETDIVELLKHVDPSQLYERNGRIYIKNEYDTKLFIDKSCMIYNQMAQRGFCEHTIAVSEHTIYKHTNGKLSFTLTYKRETPRTNIEKYTSNFLNEVQKNTPINIEYKGNEQV
jgi:hypothetical protein